MLLVYKNREDSFLNIVSNIKKQKQKKQKRGASLVQSVEHKTVYVKV